MAVAKREPGKYSRMFPQRYEDIGMETIPDIMKRIGFDFVNPESGTQLSFNMFEYCKKGRGCYTFGEINEERFGKRARWIKFCAPYSKCVFSIRFPNLPKLHISENWWVDKFTTGKSFSQIDDLSFDDFREMVIEELDLK